MITETGLIFNEFFFEYNYIFLFFLKSRELCPLKKKC